ncbi:type IV toxin-antitoxin system AbiEi family antitoxin domain-containing protein [Legionella sp. D16C41]|uniref:type IV toxin-antitoxin system AbiEi family antitoxin domain-containing protein n=1 Tax=Legionella sp. D16C41 TaxID=3402688 RepID=UPI003AF59200
MNTRINYKQKALALVKDKVIARSSELVKEGIPRIVISRLLAEGELKQAGRGIYYIPHLSFSEKESLIIVAKRVPQAIFCLFTALQLHELTTQLPRKLWVAMPVDSHLPRIGYPPIKMVKYSGEAYSAGVEIQEADGVQYRVYNIAKTIADCFKHRNKIGMDVAIEALKDAYAQNKVITDELWHYAKICRVANVMRPYIEAIQ